MQTRKYGHYGCMQVSQAKNSISCNFQNLRKHILDTNDCITSLTVSWYWLADSVTK